VLAEQPATANLGLLVQFANQRSANPRPNVTDVFGYGPNWGSYLSNFNKNLAENYPTDSPEAINRTVLRMAQNIGPLATVFHGSPHLFDKFDMSKIGTGEGAQAYGHGLYFAENPGVAQQYSKELTQMRVNAAKRTLADAGGDIDAAMAGLRSEIGRLRSLPNSGGDPVRLARQVAIKEEKLAELAMLKSGGEMSKGALYKVDLPDEAIGKMLDWDKPLSQQPQALQDLVAKVQSERVAKDSAKGYRPLQVQDIRRDQQGQPLKEMSGGAVYEFLASPRYGGTPEQTADMLRKIGVPGIKYLDQGSRAGGKGTSNYVVFDDQIPKIIGRQ
jgi:hypothetical protein